MTLHQQSMHLQLFYVLQYGYLKKNCMYILLHIYYKFDLFFLLSTDCVFRIYD
jgi:hypothetical protein